MAATALLQFTQGVTVGDAGEALIVSAGTAVTIENGGDSSSVNSWRIELLYGPVGSPFEQVPGTPLLIAQSATGNSISGSITPTSGYYGSYRIRLTVYTGTGYTGTSDVDIRNISVATSRMGVVLPPYQRLPRPLLLPGESATGKPDELNFLGQPFGYAGPTYDGFSFRLLHTVLLALDTLSPWDHVITKLADFPAPAGGIISLTSGSWAISGVIDLGANMLRVPLGENVLIKGMGWGSALRSLFGSGGTTVLDVRGTALLESLNLYTDSSSTLLLDNADAQCWCRDCYIENQDDGASPVSLSLGTYFHMSGGRIVGGAGVLPDGISVDGNFTDIYLEGVTGSGVASLLRRTAGTQGAVSVVGCRVESDCTRAINWAAANVPTQGMDIVGNRWNIATAYTGIAYNTARVVMRANMNNAGLLTETAITP